MLNKQKSMKLVIKLMGGLGNQMFQYATARSFALRNDADLVIDSWSGFVRDYQYKRSYELDVFNITGRLATPLERVPFWIDLTVNKIFKSVSEDVSTHHYGTLIHDENNEFKKKFLNYWMSESCWMTGYWQSSGYFHEDKSLILTELTPPPPVDGCYIGLGKRMRRVNSVAVGVRLYEESNNPNVHGKDGKLKSVSEINSAISKLIDKQKKLYFFIFCSYNSPILDELNFQGNNVIFVTPDSGFKDSVQSLWLMTQCRHHVFTNSTFYWWGAWLSRKNYPSVEQIIYSADNFINKDSVELEWNIF